MSVRSKARPGLRKLTNQQAIEIRLALEKGATKTDMARKYAVGMGTIEGIAKWETYRDALPYVWGE